VSALAIIAALVIEQWRPLGDRRAWSALVGAWADRLERAFNAGAAQQGALAWAVAVLPAVLAAALVHAALAAWVHPLAALVWNVVVLYLTFGFRQFSGHFTAIHKALRTGDLDRARAALAAWRGEPEGERSREEVVRLAIEEALLGAHRHVFGVIFWFVLLPGPSGAVLYRLAAFLARRWRGLGEFGRPALRLQAWLEWPAVRATAASFAVVGDFEDAIYCWRTQAAAWPEPEAGVVLAAGAGAMGVRLGMPLAAVEAPVPRPELGVGEVADVAFLDSTVGLVWRALVLWVIALFVAALLRAL